MLFLPASTVGRSAGQQYRQLMRSAAQKNLLNTDKAKFERLPAIARQLTLHARRFNTEQASAKSAGGSGQPPQFLSTHPSHESRIREIEANLPKVPPLYGKKANP